MPFASNGYSVSQATGSILHFIMITKTNKLNRKILHTNDFRFRVTVHRRASPAVRRTENWGTNRDENARFGVDLLEFPLSFSVMEGRLGQVFSFEQPRSASTTPPTPM